MPGRQNDTVAAYLKAIELQPEYFQPLLDLGIFYRRIGNYGEAERYWRKVVDLAPRQSLGHWHLGGLYTEMGRWQEGERELRRALEIDGPARPVLNNLGALYQYMGRDEEAARLFEQARALGPETYILLLNLGDSYRRLGRSSDARICYRRARQLAEAALMANPRDAAARAFVAYFALRLGDRAAAEREIEQALSFDGRNKTVIRRAAICFEAMGKRKRVLEVLQEAPPDLLRELSRQPDLTGLRQDARFAALLPPGKS
jgi:protein O-GlcNAc transferase